MNNRAGSGLIFHFKRFGNNKGTSSPSPLLLKEKGTGVEVIKSFLRHSILSGFFFALLSPVISQDFRSNNAFQEGETITYEVAYNWGPIWVDAGLVTFTAEKDKYLGKEAFHLKSTGRTYASYDLLFKVRDYYESWIDPATFKSFEFRRKIYEGGYSLINTLRFDYPGQRVISNTKSNNNPQRTDTLTLLPVVYDMLSAVYLTRTLDLANLKTDVKKPVWVIIDDCYYSIYIRSLGKEVIEAKDGSKYRCVKIAAKMVQGTIFRGEEDVLIWVTDDENKIPVYIEAKIIVGTVKAYLTSTKGLKNPVTSLVR
jgi:hypothetical protein